MNFISSLSEYTNLIIIGMVIFALILIGLVLYFTSTTVKHSAESGDVGSLPEGKPVYENTRTPPYGGLFSRYLTVRGFFHVGEVSLIFLRALELLRERLDTVHYKYFLPWYLMVGTKESGKTSLMQRSELVLPLGEQDFDIKDPHPGLRWWFMNHGIVLDVRGDYFVDKTGVGANEKGWKSIISLLCRYRSRRPIDGIILTIPASELYGQEKLSLEEINERARYVAQKLLTTQNYIGLRLPVYVVVTKTDVVPGFQNFCHTIPIHNRQNILGWSSPYHPNIAFDKGWIEEAFGYLHRQLTEIKYEIMAAGPIAEERDGVFLFPSEIMHLEKPLALYLNQIFKVSSYDESLIMRGIYFTGDSGENIDPSILFELDSDEKEEEGAFAHLSIGELDTGLEQARDLTTIYFFNDLLNDKIFKENGLAHPVQQRLISMNRNINLAKVGMIGFIGLGSYGLIKTYNQLSENRDYFLPIMGRISTILSQIPETRLDPTRLSTQMLDEQARQLLEMMHNMHKVNFKSIYFPSSWLSPVNENLRVTLKISFDQIILRTIYMDLLLKSRDMLTFNLNNIPKDAHKNSFADLLQPTKMVEFDLLKGYVQRFIDLSHHIDLYNRLGEVNDPTILRDLVAYTKQIELPVDFLENYSHFQHIFSSIPYAKIDLVPYRATAQEILRNLYVHFIDSLLSPNNPKSIIGQMNFMMTEYGHRRTFDFSIISPLRQLSHDLNKGVPELGTPGKTWIDNAYFDVGGPFAELMNEITQFKLFGPEMVSYFAVITQESFSKFQNRLLQMNSIFAPKKQAHSPKKSFPSDGIFRLQESLNKLYSEKFMAEPSGEMFETDIPKTHMVFWNPQLVDLAIAQVKAYEAYVQKNFEEVPIGLRGTIKEIARENLIANVVGILAQAQTIVPRPKALSNVITAEETLRDKIEDVKAIAPKFIKLLEVMTQGGVGTSYVSLRNLLGTLSTRLLEQVDEILEGNGVYIVKDGNFEWWNGVQSPMLEGFNVRDESELLLYFERERGLIGRLAQNYAHFMIDFLTEPVMKEYNGRDDLIVKWKGIIQDVKGYEKKNAGNALFRLEETIQKDMMNIDLSSCFLEIPLSDVKRGSADYFLNRRVELRRSLRSRCEVLQRQKSLHNYKELSDFFNSHLKDKFPFRGDLNPSEPEAEANDIREFFRMYKTMGDSPKKIYNQVYQLGAEAEDTYSFLVSMEKIKKFFGPFIRSPLAGELPTFTIEADARVNRAHEVRANLIETWILKPNSTTEMLKHDRIEQGKWVYGNDIELNLVWPSKSRIQPYMDHSQSNMQVNANVAQFTYTGHWALFRMILQQQAPRADYNMIEEPTPYILKYQIPNGPTEKTITYLRITLMTPPKGNAPGVPMQLPTFPTVAPEVSEAIFAKAPYPVLTTGKQASVEPEEETTEEAAGSQPEEASQ